MKTRQVTIPLFCAALLWLGSFSAQAATVAYEDVRFLEDYGWFTDPFQVSEAGTYTATLTDMQFPAPFLELAMTVTTSTQRLGLGLGEYSGFFDFEATPGTQYYLNVFYHADHIPELNQHLGLAGFDIRRVGGADDVTAVPLPGAGLLMGSALVALTGISRRNRPPV
ncbi:hypothetical protein [Thiohalobacter thiocyanaticus]|uniref:Uncharacterized protein n=1 Tax=Thiohalobacter thiocyanaticus TaxID=585455 RepID=A0A426QLS7_9GAMM|nr:hypothetical protein [Thiohalobacter thiocyanaticus]RRQ22723.1 hypothetical protein D6C00_12835 [Thiohalobacter thiocyanaticus]